SADPEVGVCGLSHGNDDEPQTGKARSALPEVQGPLTPGPSPAKGRGESRLELIALSPFWNSLPSYPLPVVGEGGAQRRVSGRPAPPDCGLYWKRAWVSLTAHPPPVGVPQDWFPSVEK